MRPRAVVLDLSIDMGGCFETSRPTQFPAPTYEVNGIVHFCVPNLPATAARSSTLALTNAVLPYLQYVTDEGFLSALRMHDDLRRGVYVHAGRVIRPSLARAFGWPLGRGDDPPAS
jgi:alanine dehydrogenase